MILLLSDKNACSPAEMFELVSCAFLLFEPSLALFRVYRFLSVGASASTEKKRFLSRPLQAPEKTISTAEYSHARKRTQKCLRSGSSLLSIPTLGNELKTQNDKTFRQISRKGLDSYSLTEFQ